ncbi:hypothetical protein BRM3_08215 [Brachybacterium huguangmaarense]|uniref:Uncharacterized protein n=1 Tax=Brachybacterium huguangmaarense TaxID=1652028 RepID=A0ABY6FXI6_9MICO|nr:hypothetical protein [Brachybacterium huguangmaarense]UYG15633.1 hypothetical protein BRM3_08215 [Brachybacterium huguangmaarense]
MPHAQKTPQEPQETPQDVHHAAEGHDEPQDGQETPQDAPEGQEESQETAETFPREYVEKLRQENGRYRQRAQEADDLAHRLHVQLVKATGRLADPEDLPFADDHLDDPAKLQSAVDDLLARKPHLASRRPRGDVGQGQMSDSHGTVDLAALLRSRA